MVQKIASTFLRSTHFLRLALVCLGAFVLFICVLLSQAFTDPRNYEFRWLVSFMYASALAFYVAVGYTFKLLGYIDAGTAFSLHSVYALRAIKLCAVVVGVCYVLAAPFFYDIAQGEDAPGVFALSLMAIFASVVVAVFATVLQKLLRSAISIKHENDLTV